jgi:hypothetical protein
MRIVVISDTHGLHRKLEVPNGDLLIHAGDFTLQSKPPSIVSDFTAWLGSLPHRHKVVIPGNHEFILEEPRNRGAITNATLLVDSGVEVEGIRIWGSPVTPLYGGAFGRSNHADRKRHWAQIPDDLDILITHGPPFAILDHGGSAERREGWGCGAFENDPRRTAVDFRQALEGDYSGAFSEVVFAITDWSPERRILGPFRDVFAA